MLNLSLITVSKNVKVCIPELVLNETRQDKTGNHFPNWRKLDKTTSLWCRCSGKSGKNPENNTVFASGKGYHRPCLGLGMSFVGMSWAMGSDSYTPSPCLCSVLKSLILKQNAISVCVWEREREREREIIFFRNEIMNFYSSHQFQIFLVIFVTWNGKNRILIGMREKRE